MNYVNLKNNTLFGLYIILVLIFIEILKNSETSLTNKFIPDTFLENHTEPLVS